jgi:hypothetical protein
VSFRPVAETLRSDAVSGSARPCRRVRGRRSSIDAANGIAVRQQTDRWTFPNVDLTVHLHRVPEGTWTFPTGCAATRLPAPDAAARPWPGSGRCSRPATRCSSQRDRRPPADGPVDLPQRRSHRPSAPGPGGHLDRAGHRGHLGRGRRRSPRPRFPTGCAATRLPAPDAAARPWPGSVHLHRVPEGTWTGLDTEVIWGPDGVGLTSSTLHDASRGRLLTVSATKR